jgi:phytoene dehydrogenase-like protein
VRDSHHCDVAIIGGGHNGLIAAAYLAKGGKKVSIFEAASEVGGATASVRTFPEYDARLSRYSYLVSLLPTKICRDLNLKFESISRTVSSYTPYFTGEKDGGLFVARQWDEATSNSFQELPTGAQEGRAWQAFYGRISEFAEKIAPTLLEPLPTRSEFKARIAMDQVWQELIEEPIGHAIDRYFSDDLVKGVILTDALIGTHTSAYDLAANRCFLYHLIGNGTGEWKVPRGGMGALVSELTQLCLSLGVEIRKNSEVVAVVPDENEVSLSLAAGERFTANYLLSNAAPQVLSRLLGRSPENSLDGAQLKINMLVVAIAPTEIWN